MYIDMQRHRSTHNALQQGVTLWVALVEAFDGKKVLAHSPVALCHDWGVLV